MKLFRIYIIAALALVVTSCGDDLANLNIDPNTSPTARPQEVLTSGIGYYGIALDGYFNEDNAILAQYWAGGPGVALLDIERYFLEPSDFSTEWSFAFLQSLSDLDFVIDNGNDARSGVAEILSIYIIQSLVDHYGDIPYSEALRGAIDDGAILTPKYDDAQTIYNDLIVRLDAALAKMSTNDPIGAEDLIYNGDLSKWEKFGNSLKLKLLMRQSDGPNAASIGDQVRAVIANGNFIGSADEMAAIPFDGIAGDWNPQYARREQGIGMFFVASNSFVEVMQELNDPRLGVLFDPAVNTGTIVGIDQGNVADLVSPAKDDYSFPSAVAYGASNEVMLMSNWEVMFLRAEAALRYGTGEDETGLFNNAVTAHFNFVGLGGSAAGYLASDANYDASADAQTKLRIIGTQKWISMNGIQESEGWIESRRFDKATGGLFSDAASGIFNTPTRTQLGANVYPTIRLYPQTELSFNPNAPVGRSLTDRVFWN